MRQTGFCDPVDILPDFVPQYVGTSLCCSLKKRRRKTFGFLHECVGVTGGPNNAKTDFLVSQNAETSPGRCHRVEGCFRARRNEHPTLSDEPEGIIGYCFRRYLFQSRGILPWNFSRP
jgi:hypothetical protein